MEVVNSHDKYFYNGRSVIITLGSYGYFQFKVYYGGDLASALDVLGEYCKDAGHNGILSFESYDSLLAECDNDEEIFYEQYFPINGGEYYLNIINMHVMD